MNIFLMPSHIIRGCKLLKIICCFIPGLEKYFACFFRLLFCFHLHAVKTKLNYIIVGVKFHFLLMLPINYCKFSSSATILSNCCLKQYNNYNNIKWLQFLLEMIFNRLISTAMVPFYFFIFFVKC